MEAYYSDLFMVLDSRCNLSKVATLALGYASYSYRHLDGVWRVCHQLQERYFYWLFDIAKLLLRLLRGVICGFSELPP